MNFQQILDMEKDLGPDQGLMAEMNTTGDTKITWNRHNENEIEIARAAFDAAIKKGMVGYRVSVDVEKVKGDIVRKFDPQAERIILAPPMVGGSDTVLDILRRARSLIATKGTWIKHALHSRILHIDVYCVAGAIIGDDKASKEDLRTALALVKATMHRLYPTFANHSLESFNDAVLTEHRDVLRVLDAAIAQAETDAMWKELQNAVHVQKDDPTELVPVAEVAEEYVGVR